MLTPGIYKFSPLQNVTDIKFTKMIVGENLK